MAEQPPDDNGHSLPIQWEKLVQPLYVTARRFLDESPSGFGNNKYWSHSEL